MNINENKVTLESLFKEVNSLKAIISQIDNIIIEKVRDELEAERKRKENPFNARIVRDYSNTDFSQYKIKSNVGEILLKEGKTQTWLAQKTNIPKSTLYGIINNTNAITLENSYKIALVLGRPIEEVFEYKISFNNQ